MTFDSAGAYAVVRWDTVHLIGTMALMAVSACLSGDTVAMDWRHGHVYNVAPIIQQGNSLGKTGAVVLL